MRKYVITLLLAWLAATPAHADEASVMVLEGTTAAPFDNGNFAVLDGSRGWDQARWDEWRKTAKPDEQPPIEAYGAIAWAPIGPDGAFRLEIAVDQPRVATFAVIGAVLPDGGRLSPNKTGNNFILEPGELKLRMIRHDYSEITGGHYNDAVFNSWRLSDEYRQAWAEAQKAQADHDQAQAEIGDEVLPGDDPREQARRRLWDRMVEANQMWIRLQEQGMSKVALTHPDPLARKFAIQASWIVGPWQTDALRSLAKLMPDDPWVAGMLAPATNVITIKAPKVGDRFVDFSGDTLEGVEVRLADVQSRNRLVLVEFWASWCGPCRVEIPHMKQAYSRFHDKGFEIVSYTIDEEREDWEEASAEEDLPWIDIGMGFETELAQAYSLRNLGIPRNYLLDSSTGKIVAANLYQHKLDEKLEELLD
ncbi:MAG: TlpA disulfide reductase family protein [Gammaproteobacteria bacterium]|nr:TlpA disulfide reductase family protein [Gammaproteobacteria bacterium]MDE0413470.1 TlpA disulfide reductase family protein [Gammaproteobacteria bacterium]